MFTFIREHWPAYLIGVVIALIVGFGAAYAVGVVGSTPADVRAEHVEGEQERESAASSGTDSLNTLDQDQSES